MDKVILLFAALLFIKTSAQNDYRSGYIITMDGKEIYGQIDYRPNFSNFKNCYFKTDSLSEFIKYKPDQIKGYRLTDSKYYVSKVFKLKDLKDTCFMECLISGKASIYFIQYGDKDHYFIEKDTNFIEIQNDDLLYYVEFGSEGFKYIPVSKEDLGPRPQKSKKSNQYKGILKALFNDCQEIQPQIDNLTFNKKSLINISKTYHEIVCKDEACIIYEKKVSKNIWDIGIFVNSGIQKFSYDDKYYGGSVVYLNTNPPLGIGLIIQTSNFDINNRLFLCYSVSYEKYMIDSKTNTKSYGEANYKFNFDWLKNEISVLYKFRNKKTNPYINVGIPFNIILSKDGTISSYTSTEIELDQKYMIGYSGGVGLEYKITNNSKAYFSINYLNSSSIKNKRADSFKISGLQFTLGYLY